MHNLDYKKRIGIFGASGYAGIELTRILGQHPGVELAFATSDRWEGRLVTEMVGAAGQASSLIYASNQQGQKLASQCDLVLLATPNEVSLDWVPGLVKSGVRIIDLSGSFRLKNASLYPRFYGFPHSELPLLERAVYGLPELFREDISSAHLIANPGCYATAATLALAPLLKDHLIESEAIVIDAASGVTGAGRKASEDFNFVEVEGNYSAYAVLKHRHAPEIRQTLTRHSGEDVRLTFIPHLLPIGRGILATCYARARPNVRLADLEQSIGEFCRNAPFVKLIGRSEKVHLKNVVGTNLCILGIDFNDFGSAGSEDDPGRVVIVSALDNLVKGAAGQAVQNLNLALGFEESEGLLSLRGTHP